MFRRAAIRNNNSGEKELVTWESPKTVKDGEGKSLLPHQLRAIGERHTRAMRGLGALQSVRRIRTNATRFAEVVLKNGEEA